MAIQDLRGRHPHLFAGTHTDAMMLFMWQYDVTGVGQRIDECLERFLCNLISPGMAGTGVGISLSFSLSLSPL